jgi:predicted nucleotide-binding protein
MPLPILTDINDVKSIVDYLRSKPTGANLAEAKAVLEKKLLDSRKISAYQTWDFIVRDGERIKLSARGRELAQKTKTPEEVFREVIDSLVPYRSAIEWMFHRNFETVTNVDLAAFWHEHHSEENGTDNENTLNNQAVCFFRIAEGASLGKLTIGRKGQPTRFSINRDNLRIHIEAGPSAPPWQEADTETEWALVSEEEVVESDESLLPENKPLLANTVTPPTAPSRLDERLRVFISHGKNTDFVSQVETMLELADIESEVATKEETTAIPVPDKVFSAMRRCQAGIIIVSAEESHLGGDSEPRINENVLIEIGAAFVLYDRRVVLLWDKRLPVPTNLQGLYRCEFEGDELSWSAGMKLMKAIKGFKKP